MTTQRVVATLADPPDSAQRAPIALLVVDRHPVVRWALECFLRSQAGIAHWSISASTADAAQLVPALARRPQIVLVGLGLPLSPGLALVARIRGCLPDAAILALSWLDIDSYRQAAQVAGADGLLFTDDLGARLPETIAALESRYSK